MFVYVPILMTSNVGLDLSRWTNVFFDNNFIPLNQHSADEGTKVFVFASFNVHVVVFVFDHFDVPSY